jgi:hypothetical protein|tara:strand:- start:2506 stop:2877 length:372 start_codon:yes stop_codon:yes gene_type:complete
MSKLKIIKEIVKKFKPKKIIKSKRKKLFPLETKPGPGTKEKFKKLDPKSPYYNVDELGSPPVSRGGGPSGVEKKKLKEAGERISKWYRKKEGKGPVRVQEKLPGMRHGGLIRGFPKIAMKGWK